ncbi:cobalamin-dependent protein [Paraburkholderia fungorum]|uniref:cobalamin-dependent protein n=1 Tax=Paraburkholderia fungorum TaxID=134537 RepID=UPI00402B30AE
MRSAFRAAVPLRPVSTARLVIGMTESDCHTVSIYLFKLFLEEQNIAVLNLGACVSLERMFEAANDFSAQAIVFGAQNGHAYDDLIGLQQCKKRYGSTCPIFLGGNLTVGAEKDRDAVDVFREIGVDYIVSDFESFLSIFLYLTSPKVPSVGQDDSAMLAPPFVDVATELSGAAGPISIRLSPKDL